MYKKVPTNPDFTAQEKEVLSFWKDQDIIKKSFHLRDDAEKTYTFFDGPPTANGKPHVGHVLTRAIKDLIPRFHSMKGENVLRKAGWDTHGLPVELEVEKALGLDGKPQIEEYGIEPFIAECKKSVWKYLGEWEEMSNRVGFWADMEDPYVTYHDNYIESVWWSLKQISDKGLLYKGHKIVPYCPRCGTALSSHEVAQGYKEVTETSAFVRFRVEGKTDTFLLAWTTTPWTLPSNVALCVNAKEDYVLLQSEGINYYLAKALVESLFAEKEISILDTMKGEALVGINYEPLYRFETPREKAWYVVADDYVTLSDGSGIVHIAPAFGEDDARVGRENGLPFVQMVDEQGLFVAGTPWEGTFVKEADASILEDLKTRGLLFATPAYTHNYPFCWRCDTPLLYYARPTWFIAMSKLKEQLVANNRTVNWLPENIKEGRMGNFLENVIDWGLSRERYWGTPLPVWTCQEGHVHVIGSKQELHELAVTPFDDVELHRPFVDAIDITCPECGKTMHRVKEVIDCWYDSGAMPFAQWHYPFENKERFEKRFPANFISEAIDQTRGWFYTLEAISTVLFGRAPFENCIVLGHVQDKDGIKMSKHKGNVVDPFDILERHGADAVRWYFYATSPGIPTRFSDDAVAEYRRKFMGTLQNTYAFFVMYANIDGFVPSEHPIEKAQLSLMDQWVLSKLHSLIKKVDEELSNYHISESTRAISEFVDDLSNWYVRRCRERFWGKGMAGDKEAAFVTLYTVLETLTKIIAPFVPFMAESMYQNLVKSVNEQAAESVHLSDFPICDESRIDLEMERQMDALIAVVQLGRSARNLASMKVRQPIQTLYVKGVSFSQSYEALVQDELNIKNVVFTEDARAFTTYELKPQMRTLGPKYGKLLGAIGQKLKELDGNEVVDAFERGENMSLTVNDTPVTLAKEDVLTQNTQKEGFMAQSDRGVTVVLDTNLTPELIQEGYVREAISKIQTMRKDANFDVTDRIHVRYQTELPLEKGKETIMSAVLALSFEKDEADESFITKEWDLNGVAATIAIQKA